MPETVPVPQHVAVIMDGNGRWAVKRGLPKIAGHRAGVASAERIISEAARLGIRYLTLYTFSSENWKRPRPEVEALFGLLEEYIDGQSAKLVENGIRLRAIGRLHELPERLRAKLASVIEKTKGGARLTVVLALNYGSRAEIVDSCRSLARDCASGALAPDAITEEVFAERLYTAGIPDPDLMIRTSGESRLSNYLLWQLSYAEIFITPTLWPDFGGDDLRAALAEFGRRERRYGG